MRLHECAGCRNVLSLPPGTLRLKCPYCGQEATILESATVTLTGSGGVTRPERRAAVRRVAASAGRCSSAGVGERQDWNAKIANVSAVGIGLSTSGRFEPNTTVAIEIEGAENPAEFVARVVRAEYVAENEWFLGCAFCRRIDDRELETISQREPAARARAKTPSPASLLDEADALYSGHQRRAAVRIYFRLAERHRDAPEANIAVRRLRHLALKLIEAGNTAAARRIGARLARFGHA
jgi:LSD1 subclass zinc finger protein